MTRTDVHRPSAIQPEDYQFVAVECIKIEGLGDCYFIQDERARLQAHMKRTGGTYSHHEHGGNCGICGSVNAVYTLQFYHAKTNSYVRVGQDCAQKLEMSFNEGEFNRFVKNIANARKNVAGKNKAQAILSDAGLMRCWDLYVAKDPGVECEQCKQNEQNTSLDGPMWHRCANNWPEQERIIRDIVGKLVKYGSISDKATGYLRTLLRMIDERGVREAQRKAEKELAEPCPTGRVTITGVVLSVKVVESAGFGYYANGSSVTKIFLKDDRGFTVYGTIPSVKFVENGQIVYPTVNRGDRIRFSANLKPADGDAKHGFYSRPTKGELVQAAVKETE